MCTSSLLLLLYTILYIGEAAELGRFDYSLTSCWFYWDTSAPTDVGIYSSSCSSPMPCECKDNINFQNALLVNPDTGSQFVTLTDHSWIDFEISTNPNTYTVDKLGFQWQNESDALDRPSSFISFYDLDAKQWANQSWAVDPLAGVSAIVTNGTFYDYTIDTIHFHLEWDSSSGDGYVYPLGLELHATAASKSPTKGPTNNPTDVPSISPTTEPTFNPSSPPTLIPTSAPTKVPTQSPTYKNVDQQTKRIIGVDSIDFHSDNIIPLSERNVTYANYVLPDKVSPNGNIKPGSEVPYCLTCILAWADCDASIQLEGCPEADWNYTDVNPENPNSIYHCDNGTWRFKTSCRLADWQQTYGRFELWEVDSRGVKWRQYTLEFNWWNDTCFFIDDDDPESTIPCDVLPLTRYNKFAAYFEFTMPKRWGDARNAPLIGVWYDLLSIPYSLRPELDYEYINFTFTPLAEGQNFGLDDALSTFQPAIIAVGILLACFVAVMLLSCFVSGDKKSKRDFMIDTRNLKTTFRHTPETIIVPPAHIQNRARFSCARHGPWLLVVLVARLMYMFIFTFTFFYLVFQAINDAHYDTLKHWDQFSTERDTQIVTLSEGIEIHYSNETDRMEREIEFKNYWCYSAYINETLRRYTEGGVSQAQYHTDQMNNPLGNINVNLSAFKNIFVLGDGETACNPSQTDGTIIWVSSKNAPISYTPLITVQMYNATSNTTYSVQEPASNATILRAEGYDTSFANFSDVESILGPLCDAANWCYGWGFTNAQGTDDAYYMLLNELGDPSISEGVSGVCYGSVKLDEELNFLKFNSSYFSDYTDTLNAQYISDFQSYTADLYDTLSGIWGAIQDMPTSFEGEGTTGPMEFTFIKNYNYSDNAEYGMDVGWHDTIFLGGSVKNKTAASQTIMDLSIFCPDCPQGNFTEGFLDLAKGLLFNGSNMSDYTNLSELGVNITNLISINTAFIEFPELPTIELPFDFDFPLDFSLIFQLSLTLDALLFIYRWYRTTGIVARIVRGKDVDVSLTYLMVSQSEQKCCYGRSILDYCLNCVIFCHDKIFRLSYNLWKVFFWVWWLLRIALVALLILMLYYLMDQILTVDFIKSIGVFQLMTVAIGAQRSVRNQVLCTTALGYNNYTLTNLDRSVEDYAKERNTDAWERNIDELARVDEWNILFCNGWGAYQTTARDVTSESPDGEWVDLNDTNTAQETKDQARNVHGGTYYTYDVAGIADPINLFDGDSSTYWRPYDDPPAPNGQDIVFDFYLSPIYMTDDLKVGWDIVQFTFDWRFEYNSSVVPIDQVTPISYELYLQDSDGIGFTQIEHSSGNHTYSPDVAAGSRQSSPSFVQYVTIPNEIDTRRVRLVLQNVDLWGTEYYLNDFSIAGHAPESQVACPEVQFRFWEFDASPTDNENATSYLIEETNTWYDADGTYIELCPQMTPVHGLMYRGFVRWWLNDQLEEFHTPFILALRNIALSPFFIAIILVGILFLAYLLAFIMEWFLMKLDLYRENPYAKVPLVTNNYEKYDAKHHETGELGTIYGLASVGKDYYNPTVSVEDIEDGHATSLLQDGHQKRDDIELGLTNRDPNLKRHSDKKKGRTSEKDMDSSNSDSNSD